jgi:hypothetical protein
MACRATNTTTNTTKVTHVAIVIALLLLSSVIDEARGDKADAGIHMVVKRERMKVPTHQTQTQGKKSTTKRKEKRKDRKAIRGFKTILRADQMSTCRKIESS